MKLDFYYAFFNVTEEAIEVSFPDIDTCVTFGDTWEEAYEMAVDALAGCLSAIETMPKKSSYDELKDRDKGILVPVPVDEKTIQSYQTTKRFNVIFPEPFLKKIDEYRGKRSMKRSELLLEAASEYLGNHPT